MSPPSLAGWNLLWVSMLPVDMLFSEEESPEEFGEGRGCEASPVNWSVRRQIACGNRQGSERTSGSLGSRVVWEGSNVGCTVGGGLRQAVTGTLRGLYLCDTQSGF